ncbi:MAG: hypothetical protein M1830_006787 [Pleopsidium flavum]|nr:MAG: hypothetical protein M1830_006787 [Pleopsidium flavum]
MASPVRRPMAGRPSTGGQPPRRVVTQTETFLDHAGAPIAAIWESTEVPSQPSRFAIQVYTTLTNARKEDASSLSQALFSGINTDRAEPIPWRLDINSPLPDIPACIAHYQREKEHRQDEDQRWHMVPSYAGSFQEHNSFILVVDSDSWKENGGLLFVWFDPVPQGPYQDPLGYDVLDEIDLMVVRVRSIKRVASKAGDVFDSCELKGEYFEQYMGQ